ncbi:MAG: hypothetical protein U0Z44_06730 [Kouleothrix sp.]
MRQADLGPLRSPANMGFGELALVKQTLRPTNGSPTTSSACGRSGWPREVLARDAALPFMIQRRAVDLDDQDVPGRSRPAATRSGWAPRAAAEGARRYGQRHARR